MRYIDPMAETVADLTLERMRRLEEKMDVLIDHVVEVKTGLTLVRHDIANIHGNMALISTRLDGIDKRLGRVERRLDLVEVV